jgi:hypothetical protein
MNVLKNNARRRLGIPGRPAIVLAPTEGRRVTDEQLAEMRKNRTVARWLESGVLTIEADDGTSPQAPDQIAPRRNMAAIKRIQDRDNREEVELPEGVTGEGVELFSPGGGWFEVWVNGFKATDKNVRKSEAEKIAAEYEDGADS